MVKRLMVPVQYFTAGEIGCKCGCGISNLHSMTMKKLDVMRHMLGYSLGVNSACRCPVHNKSVKGSATSSHIATDILCSHAIDLRCKNDHVRFEMVRAAIAVGFYRIGIYENFIHVDDDPQKPAAIWYGK